MRIPPLSAARRVVDALEAAGLVAAIGGSGLLVALQLADEARDWDVTVDAPVHDVIAALQAAGLDWRDATAHDGPYATDALLVVHEQGQDIDVLVGFALRDPAGVERIPTSVSARWNGLPLADPAAWARAYRLMDRPDRAAALEGWLTERP